VLGRSAALVRALAARLHPAVTSDLVRGGGGGGGGGLPAKGIHLLGAVVCCPGNRQSGNPFGASRRAAL